MQKGLPPFHFIWTGSIMVIVGVIFLVDHASIVVASLLIVVGACFLAIGVGRIGNRNQ
jgi:hypothetical protein